MADSIFDFDPVAANNTSYASIPYGPNQLYHNQIDNLFRAYAGALGGFVDDLGAVATPTGTATAIAVTLSQGFTAYGTAAGQIRHGTLIALKMPLAATAAATLDVNSLGTKKIRRQGDAAIEANDWLANGIYFFRYDTAYDTATGAWVLMNAASSGITFATNAQAMQATSTTLSVNPANLANLYSTTLGLAIEVADLKGVRLNMAGGIADAYDSQTDIDTTTSTNESYDATNDLYSPTTSGGDVWNTANKSSGVTLSNGDLTFTSIAGAGYVSGVKSTDAGIGTGKWYFEYTVVAVGTTYIGISDTASINGLSTNAGYNEGYLYANGGNKIILASSTAYGNTYTNGDVIGVAFDGDNDKIWFSKNGTWQASGDPAAGTNAASSTVTGSKIPYVGGTGSASGTVNFGDSAFVYTPPTGFSAWGPGTPTNMTLVSNAFTATAVPTVARLVTFIDPQVSITMNTDYTGEVSRDGGTTWTAVTLALTSNPVGTVEQYEGSISISAQPSGSSMKYRLKTLNNKDIDVTGTVFQWG